MFQFLNLLMYVPLAHPIGKGFRGHKLHTQQNFILAENPTYPIEVHEGKPQNENGPQQITQRYQKYKNRGKIQDQIKTRLYSPKKNISEMECRTQS